MGALFDYDPPRLGFNQSEQRLLSCALPGATDEHLAETLGTSLPAVKKMWVSIYHRVEDYLPELMPDQLQSDLPASGRGREKRRRGIVAISTSTSIAMVAGSIAGLQSIARHWCGCSARCWNVTNPAFIG